MLILKTIELYDIPPRPKDFKAARRIGRLRADAARTYEQLPYDGNNTLDLTPNWEHTRETLRFKFGDSSDIFADLLVYARHFYSSDINTCFAHITTDMRSTDARTHTYTNHGARTAYWHADGGMSKIKKRVFIIGSKNAALNTEFADTHVNVAPACRDDWLLKHKPHLLLADTVDDRRAATSTYVEAMSSISQLGEYEILEMTEESAHRSAKAFPDHVKEWRFGRLTIGK